MDAGDGTDAIRGTRCEWDGKTSCIGRRGVWTVQRLSRSGAGGYAKGLAGLGCSGGIGIGDGSGAGRDGWGDTGNKHRQHPCPIRAAGQAKGVVEGLKVGGIPINERVVAQEIKE